MPQTILKFTRNRLQKPPELCHISHFEFYPSQTKMWKNVGNHPQDEVLLHCFFLKSISLPVGQESPSLTIFTLGLDLGSCNYNQPLCSEIHTLWTFGSSLSLIPKSSALPKLGSRFGTPWFDHKSTTSPGMSSLWPPTAPRRGESVGLPGGFGTWRNPWVLSGNPPGNGPLYL